MSLIIKYTPTKRIHRTHRVASLPVNIMRLINLKQFYNYDRSRMGLLTSIGPIKDTNGLLVENDLVKAELFNNFFHSVYVSNDDNATHVIMPTPTFIGADVKKALSESKNSPSCGPDGYPPLLLKKFPELYELMCDIFNMSLVQGYVPAAWKVAHVTPIYKEKWSVLDIIDQLVSLMSSVKF